MSNPGTITKGLEGVVAANTRLSDVRGDTGQLIYCGYDIHELAGKVSYEEVVHLLHHNHLPNKPELAELKRTFAEFRELPEGVVNIIRELPRSTPPMHALRTGVSALGCFDTGCDDGLCLGRDFVDSQQLGGEEGTRGGTKQGVGGGARIREGTVAQLQLGRLTVEKPPVNFFTEGSPAGKGCAGHIGMAALRHFKVIFDYSRRRMILESSGP